MAALKKWVKFAVRVPEGPLDSSQIAGGVPVAAINAGRTLFIQQCANCHNGGLWSKSIKNFASPPPGQRIACELNLAALVPPAVPPANSACNTAPVTGAPVALQYISNLLEDVGSFNLGVAGQDNGIANNVGAVEKAAAGLVNGASVAPKDALGIDYNNDGRGEGFNVQSLLGVHLVQPYMHNGACESIACVVGDVGHRTGNGRFADLLDTPLKRRQVTNFVESIDSHTAIVP